MRAIIFVSLLAAIALLTPPARLRAEGESVRPPLEPTTQDLNAVAFSADGRLVAAAGEDGNVYLWEAATGEAVAVLLGRYGPLTSVAFFHNGDGLVAGSDNGYVTVWDVGRKQAHFTISQDQVKALAVTPDGKTLAASAGGGLINLWHLGEDKRPTELKAHQFWPSTLLFLGGGLVSADANGKVTLWDWRRGKKDLAIQTVGVPVGSVALAVSPSRLTVATLNASVFDFDLNTGKEIDRFTVKVEDPARCALSRDGSLLACVTHSGAVHLFNVTTRKQLTVLRDSGPRAWALAFSGDGSKLAVVGEKGSIAVWKNLPGRTVLAFRESKEMRFAWSKPPAPLPPGQPREGRGHTAGVRAVCFSPDGRAVASADDEGEVRLWDVTPPVARWAQPAHRGPVRGLAFSPDGQALLSGGDDQTVRFWNVRTGDDARPLSLGWRVRSVAWSPDGGSVAAGGVGGRLRVWDRATEKETVAVEKQSGAVSGLSFTPDGKHLVCATGSEVRQYALGTGARILALSGSRQPIDALSLARNGARLATACADGVVRVWDLKTQKMLAPITGAAELGGCVALAPDGKTVAFAGEEGAAVCLYNAETGKETFPALPHPQRVLSLAWSPDGKTLATGCRDRVVRLWSLWTP